jgi:hypothetical protein
MSSVRIEQTRVSHCSRSKRIALCWFQNARYCHLASPPCVDPASRCVRLSVDARCTTCEIVFILLFAFCGPCTASEPSTAARVPQGHSASIQQACAWRVKRRRGPQGYGRGRNRTRIGCTGVANCTKLSTIKVHSTMTSMESSIVLGQPSLCGPSANATCGEREREFCERSERAERVRGVGVREEVCEYGSSSIIAQAASQAQWWM